MREAENKQADTRISSAPGDVTASVSQGSAEAPEGADVCGDIDREEAAGQTQPAAELQGAGPSCRAAVWLHGQHQRGAGTERRLRIKGVREGRQEATGEGTTLSITFALTVL